MTTPDHIANATWSAKVGITAQGKRRVVLVGTCGGPADAANVARRLNGTHEPPNEALRAVVSESSVILSDDAQQSAICNALAPEQKAALLTQMRLCRLQAATWQERDGGLTATFDDSATAQLLVTYLRDTLRLPNVPNPVVATRQRGRGEEEERATVTIPTEHVAEFQNQVLRGADAETIPIPDTHTNPPTPASRPLAAPSPRAAGTSAGNGAGNPQRRLF